MFPKWHHAVPESAYFKVPETLKTFRIGLYRENAIAVRVIDRSAYDATTAIILYSYNSCDATSRVHAHRH